MKKILKIVLSLLLVLVLFVIGFVAYLSINEYYPKENEDIKKFWAKYSDEELFKWENVEIIVDENDLPGKPKDHAVCSQCGENILDGRQVVDNGVIKCRACANGAYYKIID